jgi:4-hydroxybenzoate polyprenyltransferase
MIRSTLSHVALSVPLFAAGYGASLLGPQWVAALCVALYWLGRELAQSMRPSAPLSFAWTMSNTVGFGVPAACAAVAAAVLS